VVFPVSIPWNCLRVTNWWNAGIIKGHFNMSLSPFPHKMECLSQKIDLYLQHSNESDLQVMLEDAALLYLLQCPPVSHKGLNYEVTRRQVCIAHLQALLLSRLRQRAQLAKRHKVLPPHSR